MAAVTKQELIRVAVAGLGQLSREVHLPNLASFPGVSVAALADPDMDACNAAGAIFPGARLYESVEELLDAGEADAVLIASPTAEHVLHAQLAIEAGLPFYLEKPLASEIAGACAVACAARQAGVAAMMGFNYRFHPRIAQLRQSLEDVERVESRFTIAPRELPAWKRLRSTGGGVLLDLASHHFDLLSLLLRSAVASVSANVWSERTEQDCAEVELRFESGVQAHCTFSFCRDESDVFVFTGPRRRVVYDRYAPLSFPVWPLSAFAAYQMERCRSPWKEASFRLSLAAWMASLRSREAPPVTLADGLESLRTVCAAEQSAAAGGASVRIQRSGD